MFISRLYSKVIHSSLELRVSPHASARRSPKPPTRLNSWQVLSSLVISLLPVDLSIALRTSDYDFDVPTELVAQTPAAQRDASRLLVLNRASGGLEHRRFPDLLHYLRAGDVLVLNNSRVIPARLRGANARSGGRFEILLLEEVGVNDWWAMLRPGKRAREGARISLHDQNGDPCGIEATVLEKNEEGHRRLYFSGVGNILDVVDRLGEVPLPPYIQRTGERNLPQDRERYQTVFAQPRGSVAAPTAGLHFTEAALQQVRSAGVQVCFVTLHVGLGTFAPVKSDELEKHHMHEERFELSEESARQINVAKTQGRRIVAVGTTVMRVLETIARKTGGELEAGTGRTRIFIYPPYDFRVVDVLLTNFHLPRSTLVMLVSAFASPGRIAGRDMILAAYAQAIHERYRFYSYGDAMLLI